MFEESMSLPGSPRSSSPYDVPDHANSTSIKRKLYLSHFLSTWNARAFEFGAVLFLSTIFSGTLLPASVYALVRAASAVLFSGLVGQFIDSGDRMHVVRTSILGQRIAAAVSCLLLLSMLGFNNIHTTKAILALASLSLLACIEKLCFVMNTIAIERDWVVIIAQGSESFLQDLNSQMRRIDLFCKLVAPLSISLIDGFSTKVAIITTLTIASLSLAAEYFAIASVYNVVEDLRAQKPQSKSQGLPETSHESRNWALSLAYTMSHHINSSWKAIMAYVSHKAFLPSFSLSLLYLTVFSFGGQMIAYLLSEGLNSTAIGVLRTASTLFELSATWLAPKVMHKIGAIRAGIWFLNWQIICVSVTLVALWFSSSTKYEIAGLLAGVILSRVGLWGFDLSAQVLIQEAVEPDQRGSFSAMEASFQNAFELVSFASTIIFARPDQFRYPATVSGCAVASAGILYALFVRQQRGHLFHASKCMKGRQKDHHVTQDRVRESGHEWHALAQIEEADEDEDDASSK